MALESGEDALVRCGSLQPTTLADNSQVELAAFKRFESEHELATHGSTNDIIGRQHFRRSLENP